MGTKAWVHCARCLVTEHEYIDALGGRLYVCPKAGASVEIGGIEELAADDPRVVAHHAVVAEAKGVTIALDCDSCGTRHYKPYGLGVAREVVECAHFFERDDECMGNLSCKNCKLRVSGRTIREAGFVLAGSPYDTRAQSQADQLQVLKSQNTEILAENARLRRQLERRK